MAETTHKAPGQHYRNGLSLIDVMNVFPTEKAARDWFEDVPVGRRAVLHQVAGA